MTYVRGGGGGVAKWLSRLPSARKFTPGSLKVHKIENFFGSEFEFYTISLLVMLKY